MKRRNDAFRSVGALLVTALIACGAYAQEGAVLQGGGGFEIPQVMLDQVEMLDSVEPPSMLDPLQRAQVPLPTANPQFLRDFGTFSGHLASNDVTSAAEVLASMKSSNPYEDTWLNYAHVRLEARQGNAGGQIRYLRKMFAAADSMPGLLLLPKELEVATRRALLQLEVQNNNLREALDTHARMEEKGDQEGAARFQSAIAQIRALAENDASYPVAAELDADGVWSLALLKRQFYIDEVEGKLTEAAVTCTDKSQKLGIEPLTGYTLPAALGDCVLTFSGDPGTHFMLVQYRE